MQTEPEQWAVEARRHAVELEQCSIFAADVGPSIAKAMTDAAEFLRAFEERERKLREEAKRLRKMQVPQWFYAAGYSSEDCQDSPDEVIECLDLKPGKHVVSVDCAGPMPSIWCAVTVLTDEQMDEQETDDRVVFTEHASEEEARQALKETPDAQ